MYSVCLRLHLQYYVQLFGTEIVSTSNDANEGSNMNTIHDVSPSTSVYICLFPEDRTSSSLSLRGIFSSPNEKTGHQVSKQRESVSTLEVPLALFRNVQASILLSTTFQWNVFVNCYWLRRVTKRFARAVWRTLPSRFVTRFLSGSSRFRDESTNRVTRPLRLRIFFFFVVFYFF